MCDLTSGFTLCSCAPDAVLEPPWWTLERRDESLPVNQRKGKVGRPRWSATDLERRAVVVERLNAGNCFDFDFEPRQGDVLTIEMGDGGARLRFRFEARGWAPDESNHLTSWRQQMVPDRRGGIEVAG